MSNGEVLIDIQEECGLYKVAISLNPVAAAQDLGSFLLANLDVVQYPIQLFLRCNRTLVDTLLFPVAELELLGLSQHL